METPKRELKWLNTWRDQVAGSPAQPSLFCGEAPFFLQMHANSCQEPRPAHPRAGYPPALWTFHSLSLERIYPGSQNEHECLIIFKKYSRIISLTLNHLCVFYLTLSKSPSSFECPPALPPCLPPYTACLPEAPSTPLAPSVALTHSSGCMLFLGALQTLPAPGPLHCLFCLSSALPHIAAWLLCFLSSFRSQVPP